MQCNKEIIKNRNSGNVAFNRLNEAKEAAKEIETENLLNEDTNVEESDSVGSNFSGPPTSIYGYSKGNGIIEAKSMVLDIRGRLAMLIQLLIKDTKNGGKCSTWETYLSREETMASLMAENYQDFACLASWTDVKRYLEEEEVIPVKSDAAFIQSKIEMYFATAAKVKYQQRVLTEKALSDRLTEESKDYQIILEKKDQEIQQLLLKKFQYKKKNTPSESGGQDTEDSETVETKVDDKQEKVDEETLPDIEKEDDITMDKTDITKNENLTEGATTTILEDDSEYVDYSTTNVTDEVSNDSVGDI